VTVFRRGDVVWANLEPVKPGEQGSYRPCVVVSYEAMNQSKHPCVIVCPVTGKGNVHTVYPTHCLLPSGTVPGMTKDSVVMTEQVRTINRIRIDVSKGVFPLPFGVMEGIDKALARVLAL
jgi:mRNA interferase MazF